MVKRFSVSLEVSLLDRFDEYIAGRSYNNRSEAVRDLIRDSFVRRDWEEDGTAIGVISLIYDHSQPQLQARITQLQHDCHDQIISTTHVHVDHHDCLEVIIVSGNARSISALSDTLSALRGVRNCSLSTTGTDIADHDHPHTQK
jgi:CopG family transcriptional regulator, nickel-responsive regulator